MEIKPEARMRRKPIVAPVVETLRCPEDAKQARKYECEVFNFLFQNRNSYGIDSIYTFMNLFVDGAIQLIDGRRLTVEIKLRMNWTKALQAEMEFRRFLQTSEADARPVNGAIVFFEQFQGAGWDRKAKCRFLENGWNHWYSDYGKINGYRADLFRICRGTLEYYGLALRNSMIAKVDQMPEEEKMKLVTALGAIPAKSG